MHTNACRLTSGESLTSLLSPSVCGSFPQVVNEACLMRLMMSRVALMEALIISVPILGAGVAGGSVISLFQAVTQIQEQTLSFVPKIVAMIVVTILLLNWISIRMIELATACLRTFREFWFSSRAGVKETWSTDPDT
jgi:flagellar biosynthesis protein FliQ